MKKLFLIISILLLSSCATQRFGVNSSIKREQPSGNPHFSKWSHFFVSGIGQEDFRNASELCKDNGGIAFVESKLSFAQALVTGLSYGIYSPRTMNVYCVKD